MNDVTLQTELWGMNSMNCAAVMFKNQIPVRVE